MIVSGRTLLSLVFYYYYFFQIGEVQIFDCVNLVSALPLLIKAFTIISNNFLKDVVLISE